LSDPTFTGFSLNLCAHVESTGKLSFCELRSSQLPPTSHQNDDATMASPRTRQRRCPLQFMAGMFVGYILSSFLSSLSVLDHSTTLEASGILAQNLASSVRADAADSFQEENGWSLVHVFFGNTSHIVDNSVIPADYFHSVQWFAQVRQDEIVSALLRRKRGGYFIDLAANDAVKISNTYALENLYDWTGLCIEPNPQYWPGLSYRKCLVVGAVIGASNMEEIQFKYPNRFGPKGGIVGENFDNKQASKFGEDRPRYTVTLRDVFRRFRTPTQIDYLSLDVEGAEEFIMQSFPFDDYQFTVLTVERPSDTLKSLLETNGYMFLKLLKRNSGETIWVHRSQLASLDQRAVEIDTESYKYRDSETSVYLNRAVIPV